MNKQVPQSIVLHAILSELGRNYRNVNGNSKFSELKVEFYIPESIRFRFSFNMRLPELPNDIIDRIPTIMDMQDEHPPFNNDADMGLTVRNLSVSITLWYMENHKDAILALTSN